jgi:hypothetical protein
MPVSVSPQYCWKALFMPSNNVGCYYGTQTCCTETALIRVPSP